MPTEGLSMRFVREMLRLHHEARLSQRQIARALQLSQGVVSKYLAAARGQGVSWPLPPDEDDAALQARLFPAPPVIPPSRFVEPEWGTVHTELPSKGMTLQLLWEEYREGQAGRTYSYSQFCARYRDFRGRLKRSLRQIHVAGEKCFTDYAGPTVPIVDMRSGEVRRAQVFVAVLGASNYTYSEASWTQGLPDWTGAHARMFSFFEGSTQIIVADNLKPAVTKACNYEPILNRTAEDFARHYATVIIPTRPRKPRDKAKVEGAVLVAERWILARLRKHTFFSLAELNTAIQGLIQDLNSRPFKKLPVSRREAFLRLDRPMLTPLPPIPYEYAIWKNAHVHIDSHVEVERHYYSVPHALVGERVEVRITATTIEVCHRNVRVASHIRSPRRGAHTTVPAHLPKAHRKHLEWSPKRLLAWGASIGPATRTVVDWQLTHKPHPEQGYRACLGLLNLARRYGNARLEAGCLHAVRLGSLTRATVLSILSHGLDSRPLPPETPSDAATESPAHENVRGPDYYH